MVAFFDTKPVLLWDPHCAHTFLGGKPFTARTHVVGPNSWGNKICLPRFEFRAIQKISWSCHAVKEERVQFEETYNCVVYTGYTPHFHSSVLPIQNQNISATVNVAEPEPLFFGSDSTYRTYNKISQILPLKQHFLLNFSINYVFMPLNCYF